MTSEELESLKAATEGAAAGLTQSFHAIVINLLGGASKQIGLELEDIFRHGRLRRAHARAERAVEILRTRQIVRRDVPLSVFVPLLEAAGLETDADLQERWSQLLAAAADANFGTITRAFVEILQELTPQDGRLLEWILDREPEPDANIPTMTEEVAVQPIQAMNPPRASYESLVHAFGLSADEFMLTCSRLERLGLCDVGRYVFPTRFASSGTGPRRYDSIALRPLGIAFVNACRGN